MRQMRRLLLIGALIAVVVGSLAGSAGISVAQSDATTYVVQAGDTLYSISLRFHVSVPALAQTNHIPNINLIFVSQVLTIPTAAMLTTTAPGTPLPSPSATLTATQTSTNTATNTATVTPSPTATPIPLTATSIPSGTTYTVQPGDTLNQIARHFGTTITALAAANNIVNTNLIFVGQVLTLVSPTTTLTPTSTTAATAIVAATAAVTSTTATTAPTTTPKPGITPAVTSIPVPGTLTGFALGGQVLSLNSNTQAVMHGAKLTWVKYQLGVGDGNGIGLLTHAKTAGFKVLFSIIGDKSKVLDPAFQDQYATYAASLAKAGANAIEVWNEENIDREWPTGQINPASYVTLLRKAFTAIKAANTATIVISGALSPTGAENAFGLASVWNDDRYYNGLAINGAGAYADCIGVHYNEGIVSPTQISGDPRDNYPTRYFDTMLNRALVSFPNKKACFTELGYLTPEGYAPLPTGFTWAAKTTAAQQAQWLGQAVTRARNSGRVAMLIVFNVDFTAYGADPQAGYAILRPRNVCLACTALSAAMP